MPDIHPTPPPPRAPGTPNPDAPAILAIRAGDTERYRELIERYQRQVYAVAWSHLGDASLAEDAVQESFIKAFRYLAWLRDPGRFAAWLSRIARGVAINLGLRHRRELRRRERWSLDATTGSPAAHEPGRSSDPSADAAPATPTPEHLRHALARLPARHRECLVLHYLEGQSVSQAAHVLGIQEGAFKVRLHRARIALRAELEKDIAASLEHLAPKRCLAHAIMSGIAAKAAATDPAGLIPTLAASVAGTLAKVLPVGALFAALPLAAGAAGLGVATWAARADQANYRDPQGHHARQHARVRSEAVVLMLALVACVALTPMVVDLYVPAIPEFRENLLRQIGRALLVATVLVGGSWTCLEFQLRRSLPDLVRNLAFLLFATCLALDLSFDLPPWFRTAGMLVYWATLFFLPLRPPVRHDHSLLLRWDLGLLPDPPASALPGDRFCPLAVARPAGPAPGSAAPPVAPERLAAFGHLLARDNLVRVRIRRPDGYRFALTPISPWYRFAYLHRIGRHDSTLDLATDGSVAVHLSRRDLESLKDGSSPAAAAAGIASSVQAALAAFLSTQSDAVPALLGRQPDHEIFRRDPDSLLSWRLQRILAGITFIILAVLLTHPYWKHWLPHTPTPVVRPQALQPVSLDLAGIEPLFRDLPPGPTTNRHPGWLLLRDALERGLWMPPSSWATEPARTLVAEVRAIEPALRQRAPGERLAVLLEDTLTLNADRSGWLPPGLLARHGLTPDTVRSNFTALTPPKRVRLIGPHPLHRAYPSRAGLDVLRLFESLAFLQRCQCLDLVDPAPIVAELARHQVLPNLPPLPDLPHAGDRGWWTGLFATLGLDPITETHDVLRVLDLLGRTDAIDRDAVVAGLLKLHRGRGYFHGHPDDRVTTPSDRRQHPLPPLDLLGDARTTHRALDSLRLLGSLDRVPDRNTWEFCPAPVQWTAARRALRKHTWDDVEAVLFRDHWQAQAHPGMPPNRGPEQPRAAFPAPEARPPDGRRTPR